MRTVSIRDAKNRLTELARAEFKKRNGIKRVVMSIPADFDEPLPEDVLLKPLPPGE